MSVRGAPHRIQQGAFQATKGRHERHANIIGGVGCPPFWFHLTTPTWRTLIRIQNFGLMGMLSPTINIKNLWLRMRISLKGGAINFNWWTKWTCLGCAWFSLDFAHRLLCCAFSNIWLQTRSRSPFTCSGWWARGNHNQECVCFSALVLLHLHKCGVFSVVFIIIIEHSLRFRSHPNFENTRTFQNIYKIPLVDEQGIVFSAFIDRHRKVTSNKIFL